MTDKGKVILITGASRGVGKGIAESVGKPADTIICVGRSVDSGTTVSQFGFEINSSLIDMASNIEKQGIECDVLPADLNLKKDIQNIQSIIEDKYGRLDMLIHAACQIHDDLVLPKPFWEKSTDLWSVIEVGLKSNYFLSHALASMLIKTPKSLVVQISSHGSSCYMHGPIYGAQKAGIDKMAFDMAFDFKDHDVCSVSLWSGIVLDEKTEKVSKNMDEQYAEFLKGAASQAFAGKVIRAFYDQENKMQHSGKTLIAAEVGKELGITNPDGTQPRSDREMLGGPKDFNEAVVY